MIYHIPWVAVSYKDHVYLIIFSDGSFVRSVLLSREFLVVQNDKVISRGPSSHAETFWSSRITVFLLDQVSWCQVCYLS